MRGAPIKLELILGNKDILRALRAAKQHCLANKKEPYSSWVRLSLGLRTTGRGDVPMVFVLATCQSICEHACSSSCIFLHHLHLAPVCCNSDACSSSEHEVPYTVKHQPPGSNKLLLTHLLQVLEQASFDVFKNVGDVCRSKLFLWEADKVTSGRAAEGRHAEGNKQEAPATSPAP